MEEAEADGAGVGVLAPAIAHIGAQLDGLEDHVMILAWEVGGCDTLQEQGDDLGREGLGHRRRNGLLLLVLASQGLEEGVHGGRESPFGDKEDLKPACGIAQVRMEFRQLRFKGSQGTL
ncbi:hypothetical protein KSX_93120 [Ktedonospora formicarum]|uniref:Uncharacterized protein n=1 Tax=Ktedonospora formicarum TaxID=2778364 RepID=A0A8J3I7V7_9CHLR|nr:hypothetical protein KSX_93120 [Ktedonospora formicarum]